MVGHVSKNWGHPGSMAGCLLVVYVPFRSLSRDPYIIHLNIALQLVVSLYFGGKSHVSNGQHVSFKEPC